MESILINIFGASWRTTLIGLAEAGALGALTFALNTEYNNPRIFWSGMGLSILAAVRGRITKDVAVSNAPDPLKIAKPVSESTK